MNSILLTGLVAMLVQQAFATVAKMTLPVLGPLAAADLRVDPSLIGVFVSVTAAFGLFTTLSCGNFIRRYGALRTSQWSLFVVGVGLGVMGLGLLPAMLVAAALIGLGSTVATPASSHILARHCPPRFAPVVFSIKQTGVPVGVMLTGLILPPLAVAFGWGVASVAAGIACCLFGLLLQPIRARYDNDRVPNQPLHWGDAMGTLARVLRDASLRPMAAAGFAFIGLQAVFTTFTVTYLVEVVGQSVETAGSVFGLAMTVAIPARIVWGYIASGRLAPRVLLAGFGLSMFVAVAAMGLMTAAWPLAGIAAVVLACSATAGSWHGVLLAEVARVAPPGQVAGMTGGVLAFGNAGQILLPSAFSALFLATGSYLVAFAVTGIPAAAAGVWLLRQGRAPRANG
jgi:predicted MFS family arabinose efflux permease